MANELMISLFNILQYQVNFCFETFIYFKSENNKIIIQVYNNNM